jgi:hypothetical protein
MVRRLARLAVRAVPFLALGAVTAIAVAWGVGASLGKRPVSHRFWMVFDGIHVLSVEEYRGSTCRARVVRPFGGAVGQTVAEQLVLLRTQEEIGNVAPPRVLDWGPYPSTPGADEVTLIACGWPMVACWLENQIAYGFGTTTETVRYGVALGSPTPLPFDSLPRALPLRPIPLGLAIDSALFGGGWWLLLCGSRILAPGFARPAGAAPSAATTS